MLQAPRLACEQCKRRKIRCDKGSPCSACKNADLDCRTVQRARLPRGKSGKTRNHNKRLEDRVAKIEALLARQSSRSRPSTNDSAASGIKSSYGPPTSAPSHVPSAEGTSFVAVDFWMALSEEVTGLRETLESSEDEDNEADDRAETPVIKHINATSGPGAILFKQSGSHIGKPAPLATSLEFRTTLLHIYRSQIGRAHV